MSEISQRSDWSDFDNLRLKNLHSGAFFQMDFSESESRKPRNWCEMVLDDFGHNSRHNHAFLHRKRVANCSQFFSGRAQDSSLITLSFHAARMRGPTVHVPLPNKGGVNQNLPAAGRKKLGILVRFLIDFPLKNSKKTCGTSVKSPKFSRLRRANPKP